MKHVEDVIAALADVMVGDAHKKEHELYKEALRALVRLAQAEQLCEMQNDFNALTSPRISHPLSLPTHPDHGWKN